MQEFYHCRNLRALRKILREADQLWTEQFLHHGGLKAIFAALAILREKEVKAGAEDDVVSMLQCEAVECLKAAMNSGYGLEYVISSSERFVDSLVSGTSGTRPRIFFSMKLYAYSIGYIIAYAKQKCTLIIYNS